MVYFKSDFLKYFVGALVGAAVSIPSIAAGYYILYKIVTFIGA